MLGLHYDDWPTWKQLHAKTQYTEWSQTAGVRARKRPITLAKGHPNSSLTVLFLLDIVHGAIIPRLSLRAARRYSALDLRSIWLALSFSWRTGGVANHRVVRVVVIQTFLLAGHFVCALGRLCS